MSFAQPILTITGALLFLFGSSNPGRTYQAPPHERFVGVLDFRLPDASGSPGRSEVLPVHVYAEPDMKSELLSAGADLIMMEIGDEENGAVVYERRSGGWSLVHMLGELGPHSKARGWVQDTQAKARFVPLETFLTSDLVSATNPWDRRLFAEPNGHELNWEMPSGPQPIGLLQVSDNSFSGDSANSSWDVFASPASTSPRLAHLDAASVMDVRRVDGICPCGLIVLGRQNGWYAIGLANWRTGETRLGWIRPPADAGRFVPFQGSADRERVFGPPPALPPPAPGPRHLRVLGGKWIGKDLWLNVEVLSHTICSEDRSEPRVIGRGWIPAFGAKNRLNVQVATRGC